MTDKKWYHSKTVWSGICKVLAGVLTSLASFLGGEMNAQAFFTGVVATVWGINDIIIRFKTHESI